MIRFLRSHFWFNRETDAVLNQQAELIRKNFNPALFAFTAGSWVMTGGLLILLHEKWLLLWAIAYTLYSGVAILNDGGLKSHASARTPSQKIWNLTLWMTGIGGFWALLATLLISLHHAEALMLYIVLITGVSGGALAFASPYLPAFLGLMLPPLLAISINCLLLGHSPLFIATGLAAPVYLTALWFFAATSHKVTQQSIRLRFENQYLVEDLMQQTQAAEIARTKAEHADLAKSKFLAAASHDLRQPVHALSLFLGALDRTNLTPVQLDILLNADNANKACREMLETLLDFSRIEANVIHANPVDFALQPMLYRVFNEFGNQADQRELVLRLRDTRLWAYADPLLTELIVRNLLSNALRYTDSGGILLATRQRRHLREAVIEVWDTGIGIATQHQQEIFQEFHQLGNPERDQRKGLGLGLAIVAGLCRAMAVRVSLDSQSGRGSVFRLHLPLSSPRQTVAGQFGYTMGRRQAPSWPRKLRGLRILAIDDNPSIQNAIRFLLDQQGCECKTAESIQTALPLLRDWQPDLLVVDYRLQDHQSGGDAIRTLRLHLGANIPAIIITGDTDPQHLREASSLHATLLHKPLTAETLFRAIAAATGK